jgi:hypothetical protein
MEFIPIPYFGMIMFFFVAPALTFGFISYIKKIKADVEKKKYQKEILELEIRKEEIHLKMIEEENKKYDKMIGLDKGKEEKTET